MSPASPSILCGEGWIMTLRSCIRSAALALALTLVVNTVIADVVAVVSSKSTISSLSIAQVAEIFLGKVSRFPDGTPAVPIDQAEGSAARDEFYATFASKSPAQVKSLWAKIIFTGRGQPPKAVPNSTEVRKLLAANPQAIGYIERGAIDSTVKVLAQP
jgi:ABC-type phosphate transport system substrate-binding protein